MESGIEKSKSQGKITKWKKEEGGRKGTSGQCDSD